jgi:hypothetical protein
MAKSQQFFSRELLGFINKTKIDNRDYMWELGIWFS